MSNFSSASLLVVLGSFAGYMLTMCMAAGMSELSWVKLVSAAIGGSMLTQAAMAVGDSGGFAHSRRYSASGWDTGVVLAGGCISGVGMYLCGSIPLLLPVQVIVGMSTGTTALFAVGGACTGITAFTVLNQRLPSYRGTNLRGGGEGSKYSYFAVPIGVVLVLLSTKVSLSLGGGNHALFLMNAYELATVPTVTGLVLGALQYPLRMLTGSGVDGMEPLLNIVSTITAGEVAPGYQLRSTREVGRSMMLFYISLAIGAVVYQSQTGGGYYVSVQQNVSAMNAFGGGFLMLFGAQLGGGCITGHGITGVSELSPGSLVGVVAMVASMVYLMPAFYQM